MVDKKALGAVGEPFQMVVERGKIAEMAKAVQATHPHHRGPNAVPPPTYFATQFHWEDMVKGANPWDKVQMSQERGMHAEQEYIFHGPPPAPGTVLNCQSRISEIYEKQGRKGGTLTFVVMVTEFRDESGTLVAEAKLTGVETSKPPEDDEEKKEQAS